MIYYVLKDTTNNTYLKRMGESFTVDIRNADFYKLNEVVYLLEKELDCPDKSLKVIPVEIREVPENE